jgi:AcrR family transcriptional regulator
MTARPRPLTDAARRMLDAAGVVFGRYGFRRASMDAVAVEAGVSRQGLYRHFASKDALFTAVVEGMHDGADAAGQAALEAARAAGGDTGAQLGAVLGARLAYFTELIFGSPHAAELVEESNRLGRQIIARRTRQFRTALVAQIAAAQAQRRLKLAAGTSAADLADLLILATHGAKYGTPLPKPAKVRADAARIVQLIVAGAQH